MSRLTTPAIRDNPEKHEPWRIYQLFRPPVLVGHSMGGWVVQHLLGQGLGAAAVAISPGQIRGVKAVSLTQGRAVLPILGNPDHVKRAVSLSAKQFRFCFGNAVSTAESDALHEKWSIPSPARPLFQLAYANFVPNSPAAVDVRNDTRGPLLLLSGKLDHTIPDVLTAPPSSATGTPRRSPTTSASTTAATLWSSTAAGTPSPTPRCTGSAKCCRSSTGACIRHRRFRRRERRDDVARSRPRRLRRPSPA
ncbi:alpha/beta hydrolase [Nocardia brasiliensis]|uniref:alpha/beta hydrolase n=1 Tax=Nocardia brasiliensis TaxID=37326 RepID=UPI002458369F|nr:alpha/beta hydrolase [Nocardia brasiliensis]